MTMVTARRAVLPCAWVALAFGCGALCYGLWRYQDLLANQPLWSPETKLRVMAFVGVYALIALLLRLLPALPARIAGSGLVATFVLVAAGPLATLAALLVGTGCLAAGDLVVRRLPADIGLMSRLVLSVLAGAALFALLVTVTAHFPVNHAVFFAAVSITALAFDARGLISLWHQISSWYRRPRLKGDYWTYPTAALLGGLLLLLSVRAILPETGGDGLGMHLVVASHLATFHQWAFDPLLFEWSLYPMASEWLQGVGWTLGGEQAARLIQFGFMLAAIAAIVAAAQRFASPAAALLAGSLFAAAGLAFGLSANTYAEPALAAFCLGAFVVVILPREGWSSWASVVFGLLCGGCLLTKVTSLYLVPLLLLVLVVRLVRVGGWRWACGQAGVAIAVLAAAGAAPYLYAFWRTGNPVFPLYNSVFHSSLAPLERPPDPRWFGHFSWKIPVIATFRSSYYCESYNGTLGFQYLALLPLALVVTVSRRLWRAGAALLVGLVAAVALLYSMQYTRYVFPMMGLVSIALAAAFSAGHRGNWRWVTRVAAGVALAVLGLNLYLAPGGQWNLPGFEVEALVSGSAQRNYEDKYAPQRSLNRIVNDLEGSDVRVAYFGPAYAATVEGTPYFAMGYNPRFRDEVALAVTDRQLLGVLRNNGIDYVIAPLDMASTATLLGDALASGAERIDVVNGAALYRLRR